MASDALISNTPREQAGAHSFRAFDFQVHASMARILDAYLNGDDFIAYFDLFDDLIFLNEEDGSVAMSFFQIKARAGSAWTANRLASRPTKGDPPKSIIGKAYHNLHVFGNLVHKAAIVSNQHLKAKYPNDSRTTADSGEILLSALHADDHEVLVTALNADFPNGIDPRHAEVLVYERIPLDMQSFRQTLLGKVTDFVVTIGQEYAMTAKPLYDALLSEITRCTGTFASAKTLTELKKQKGLGRSHILALVERVRQRGRTPAEWWSTVAPELVSAGWMTVPIRRLYLACFEYWRARERSAAPALHLSQALVELIERRPDLLSDSIVNSLNGYEHACTVAEPEGEPYTLQAAILVEMMESLG